LIVWAGTWVIKKPQKKRKAKGVNVENVIGGQEPIRLNFWRRHWLRMLLMNDDGDGSSGTHVSLPNTVIYTVVVISPSLL